MKETLSRLKDKVRHRLDERKIAGWKRQLASFEPGFIRFEKWDELHLLSKDISTEERLARIELVRAELDILLSHIETHNPWWRRGAEERLAETWGRIHELDDMDEGDEKTAQVHQIAQEMSKLVKATLHNTSLDIAN